MTTPTPEDDVPISPELIEILACPKCKGPLEQQERGFACQDCRLLFPIDDDIPNFLIEEAVPLDGAS